MYLRRYIRLYGLPIRPNQMTMYSSYEKRPMQFTHNPLNLKLIIQKRNGFYTHLSNSILKMVHLLTQITVYQMQNKIVRSICYFDNSPSSATLAKLLRKSDSLARNGFLIQTMRICSPDLVSMKKLDNKYSDSTHVFGIGTIKNSNLKKYSNLILASRALYCNLDLTQAKITSEDIEFLFNLIESKPEKTFNFSYVFNNAHSSPFFPSGTYYENGFSIGLQPTDLSEGCKSLRQWLDRLLAVWAEINAIFQNDREFLGIDSSIASLYSGKSSFIEIIKSFGYDFSHSITTSIYIDITSFIKKYNPKPAGLCGIMFPCLEDFGLANEYIKGNFPIERNIYLALHSGLGIDTYPVGINENKHRVLEILQLLQGLSAKYKKPLAARFVSDGKARIGEKTDFDNPYLKDVIVKPL